MILTILLVEDNEHIMKINSDTLTEAGYRVLKAKTATEARSILESDTPDLIVLDIMLPDGDGLEFCRDIRGDGGDIPILFLSAKKENDEIIQGLRSGGDDYLSKPYDLGVLLAHVEALLRRAATQKLEPAPLRFGALEMRFVPRRVLLHGADLLLEPKEFALLEILLRNRGGFISSEKLYEKVWGMNTVGDIRTVKVRISQLRQKLADGFDIESKWGNGYQLVEKPHDNVTEK